MNPETNFSIKCLKGGFDNNLSYVISCSHTGNQVLVDASIELKKELNIENRYTWGDGDSLDRERVRDILLQNYNFQWTK